VQGDAPPVRTLATVIGVSSCASCASLCFAPLSPFLVRDLRLGYAAVGALNAALFVGAAVASPFAGRWVDRLGYGPALTLGVMAMSGCVAAAAAVGGSYWPLVVATASAGVAFGVVNPAANLAVGSSFDPARRGTVMGVKQTGISLGGIAAGLWLPAMAVAYGWRVAVLGVAGLLVVAAVVSAVSLGAPRVRAARAPRGGREPVPRFYALWLGGVLLSCPQAFLMTYLVLYVAGSGGVGAAGAGALYAAVQGAALTGRVALGAASDAWGGRRRTVLIGASLVGALSMAGLTAVPAGQLGAVAAVSILGGLTAIGWNGVYMAALVDLAPPEAAGAVSGVGVGLNLAAVVVFPLLAGAALDAGAGFDAIWLAGGICALAAAVCFAANSAFPLLSPLSSRQE
jgi:MFS family permease